MHRIYRELLDELEKYYEEESARVEEEGLRPLNMVAVTTTVDKSNPLKLNTHLVRFDEGAPDYDLTTLDLLSASACLTAANNLTRQVTARHYAFMRDEAGDPGVCPECGMSDEHEHAVSPFRAVPVKSRLS